MSSISTSDSLRFWGFFNPVKQNKGRGYMEKGYRGKIVRNTLPVLTKAQLQSNKQNLRSFSLPGLPTIAW